MSRRQNRLSFLSACLMLSSVAFGQTTSAGPSFSNQPGRVRAGQLERLHEKLMLTQSILANVSADASAKGATPEWRESLAALLYLQSNESLRTIALSAHTLDEAHAAASGAASEGKALGDAGDDLVFTPITPCRFIDTRNVGGPISTVRVFDTANTGASYGGSAACALSGVGEPAVALNLTVTAPTDTGYLVLRPQGSTDLTSFINWSSSGPLFQQANAGIVATTLAGNGHYEFEITGNRGTPQVIVDYFGYFSAPAGTVTGNGGAGDGVDGITSGIYNSGVYGHNTAAGKGVFGESDAGQGVAGQSDTGVGIYGFSTSGSGVYGKTEGTSGQTGAAGVWGDSGNYFGVWGTSANGDGVHGTSLGASASGVAGINNSSGFGVYGASTSGYAIYSNGASAQARNGGGMVKAMFYVNSGSISKCFNSQLPQAQSTSPPCGITGTPTNPGQVTYDMGFQTTDRFILVSTAGIGYTVADGDAINCPGGAPNCIATFSNANFYVFVF